MYFLDTLTIALQSKSSSDDGLFHGTRKVKTVFWIPGNSPSRKEPERDNQLTRSGKFFQIKYLFCILNMFSFLSSRLFMPYWFKIALNYYYFLMFSFCNNISILVMFKFSLPVPSTNQPDAPSTSSILQVHQNVEPLSNSYHNYYILFVYYILLFFTLGNPPDVPQAQTNSTPSSSRGPRVVNSESNL